MKTVKLKASGGKAKGDGILQVQGSLTLDCVEQLLKFFREGVAKYQNIRVEATGVTGIDLGFLQLLHALDECQHARGKTLDVSLALEPEMAQLLHHAGFAHWTGQLHDGNNS